MNHLLTEYFTYYVNNFYFDVNDNNFCFLSDAKLPCIKNAMEQEMFGTSLHGFAKHVKHLKLSGSVVFVP